MRKIILSILGLLILGGAIFQARKIMSSKEDRRPVYQEKKVKVFLNEIKNSEVPVSVKVRGRLEAVEELDIFSEVQGIFQSQKVFRPGSSYQKGELLMRIDDTQEMALLRAQRSTLLNQVIQILPDIKFDYPEQYDKWSAYVANFDVNQKTAALPQASSDREKFFIAAQNLSTTYYNIKEREARLEKYKIYAPFSGILTEALVTPGSLVRPGQQLGTLVSQRNFELALSVREEYAERLRVGSTIRVESESDDKILQGKIVRINPALDPASQSLTAYVSLRGSSLREGMFFTAILPLTPIPNAVEIDRKLLVNNKYVYGVQDSVLIRYDVIPAHYNTETVVVQGLADSSRILERMIPGAREGMKIEEIKK